MTREALYVASSRGRERTAWYAATETPVDVDGHTGPDPKTVREVLTGVLARTGAEDSARDTIRSTLEDATSLRTLVARYQHARSVAAADALRDAAQVLPSEHSARILGDKAAPHLATVLADAASRGASPRSVLRKAFEYDDLTNVASPALVLATRIRDYSRTLGVPDQPPADRPLPWLPGPEVGHEGWEPYLQERASLIEARAAELGSHAAAYREQYAITDAVGIGDLPQPHTDRRRAYEAAAAESQLPPARRRLDQATRVTRSQQQGPRLGL